MAKLIVDTTNFCNRTDEEMFGLFRVKSSPFFWREKAEQLKYSSDVLLPKAINRMDKLTAMAEKEELDLSKLPPDTFAIAYGLLGFSLECLFKACIIRDNPHFVDKGKHSEELKNHNLLQLATIGKIELNEREKGACETLTEYMYVDFRYPIDRVLKPKKRGLYTMYSKSISLEANEIFARLHKTVSHWHFAKGGERATKGKTSNLNPRKAVKKSTNKPVRTKKH